MAVPSARSVAAKMPSSLPASGASRGNASTTGSRHPDLGPATAMMGSEELVKSLNVSEGVAKFLNGISAVRIDCDICGALSGKRRLDADANLWTCQGGSKTLLHGQAYDVWEACYSRHVGIAS